MPFKKNSFPRLVLNVIEDYGQPIYREEIRRALSIEDHDERWLSKTLWRLQKKGYIRCLEGRGHGLWEFVRRDDGR